MHEHLLPSEYDELREQFAADYRLAWEGSRKPNPLEVAEVLEVALADAPQAPTPSLHALWIFMRVSLGDKNIPISWFMQLLPRETEEAPQGIVMRFRGGPGIHSSSLPQGLQSMLHAIFAHRNDEAKEEAKDPSHPPEKLDDD